MPDTHLVVPVQLDALAVNRAVLNRHTFRWWQFNYLSLQHFKSPEPLATDRSNDSVSEGVYLRWTLPEALRHGLQNPRTGEIEYPLVPNRWLILRFGGTKTRAITAGWVVESDCPHTSQTGSVKVGQTSLYLINPAIFQMWKTSADVFRSSASFIDRFGKTLTPESNQPLVANIGISFDLNEWKERAADQMFLTALAPANDFFSVYYPHNVGVFSFCDELKGVDQEALSYLVLGWYSDPQKDVMRSWQHADSSAAAYENLLENLRWTVAGNPPEKAATSVYQGMVFSVGWDRHGAIPPNDPLTDAESGGSVTVAIGNTTIDAFTSLVEQQFKTKGYDAARTKKLLEAFQYDLLPVLNEVNGDALLDEKIRDAWFGSKPGGYRWSIVAAESDDGDDDAAPTAASRIELTAEETEWLLRLNRDQHELDRAVEDLHALQWELNAHWYRKGYLFDSTNVRQPWSGVKNVSEYIEKLNARLDSSLPESLAAKVLNQISVVRDLLAKVPQPDAAGAQNSPQAFQNGVQKFARQKNLPETKKLKAVAAARYWKANEPVIVISGVEPSPSVTPNQNLNVRLATYLINEFKVGEQTINRAALGDAVPMPANLTNLPAPVSALVTEFFMLDPAGSAAIAAKVNQPVEKVAAAMSAHDPSAYQKFLPDSNLQNWSQSWNPMFIEWRVSYNHISAKSNDGSAVWKFDGTDYRFSPESGALAANQPRSVSGISLLSPHSKFIFRARLKEFVSKYAGETDLKNFYEWIGEIDKWKFLSQEMSGFGERLALRDRRAFRRPSPLDKIGNFPLAEMLGFDGGGEPAANSYSLPEAIRGEVGSVPFIPNGPALEFHGTRQGQMYFEDLIVYDQFGRSLHLVSSKDGTGAPHMNNFPLIRDEALIAETKISQTNKISRVVQLPPRLLQYARLDFELADGRDDGRLLGLSENVNPVCGWVLHNHLDGGVLLYAPDGASLGEFRLVVNAEGEKIGEWQPPAHGEINTLEDVAKAAPHLKQMIAAARFKEAANFRAFLEAIDDSLWTIDGHTGNRADANLALLVGRPLALVRARLQLKLDGAPLKDTGWAAALDPPAPAFLKENFAVRLGDRATRQDGLIGYFAGENYETFNSLVPPARAAQNYLRQIGPLGAAGGGNNYLQLRFEDASEIYITFLADPRAGVHAATGILPSKRLDIPSRFVDEPLGKIEIGFRVGPLLAAIEPATGEQQSPYSEAISYPFPAAQKGEWSWWERDAATGKAKGFALLNATPNARFKTIKNTLRDGVLQFVAKPDENPGEDSEDI